MNRDFTNMREHYGEDELDEKSVPSNPFILFDEWFELAKDSGIKEVNAMVLSTVDITGQPDGRVVLLKEIANGGFVFFTNFTSAKGNQLEDNAKASLTFPWIDLERQVRVQGVVEKYDAGKSETYFQSRPKMSQVAAWASPQSKVIKDRESLEKLYSDYDRLYADKEVLPKPPLWGGYLLLPHTIEFWQGRRNRLHDRVKYTRKEGEWTISRLAP